MKKATYIAISLCLGFWLSACTPEIETEYAEYMKTPRPYPLAEHQELAGVKRIYPNTKIEDVIDALIVKTAEQELRLRKLEKYQLEISENQKRLSAAMLELTKRVLDHHLKLFDYQEDRKTQKHKPVYYRFLDYVKKANLATDNPKYFICELRRLLYTFKPTPEEATYLHATTPFLIIELLSEHIAIEALHFFADT